MVKQMYLPQTIAARGLRPPTVSWQDDTKHLIYIALMGGEGDGWLLGR
jgi:hypothetical protein